MSHLKNRFILIDVHTVKVENRGTRLRFAGKIYSRRKVREFEKGIGRWVNIFRPSEENKKCSKKGSKKCKYAVKEVLHPDNPNQIRGSVGSEFYYQCCSHDTIPSPCIFLRDRYRKVPKIRRTKKMSGSKRKRDTRKRQKVQILTPSIIDGVFPPFGPLEGGNMTSIYLTISSHDGIERFQQTGERNDIIGVVMFGRKTGEVGVVNDASRWKVSDEIMNLDLYKEMKQKSRANIVVQAKVPEGDVAGPVNVSLSIFQKVLVKENGYTYVQKKKETEESFRIITNLFSYEEEEDQFVYDQKNNPFHEEEEEEDGFDFTNGQPNYVSYQVDVFGGNALMYAIAQDEFRIVKYFVEEKGYDLEKTDMFGFTPLDVAQHFKRKKIEEYIKRQLSRKPIISSECSSPSTPKTPKTPKTPSSTSGELITLNFKMDSYLLKDHKMEKLKINSGVTVNQLKKEIHKMRGNELKSDRKDLVIVYNGTYLSDYHTLVESLIHDNDVVDVRITPKTVERMGIVGTQFVPLGPYSQISSVESNDKLKRSGLPSYRIMKPGMSFDYKCWNEKCELSRNYQVINFEFGNFDVVILYARTRCSYCNERIKPDRILRVGFRRCFFSFTAITMEYGVLKSKGFIKVGYHPHWLEGGLTEGKGSESYRKVDFVVSRKE